MKRGVLILLCLGFLVHAVSAANCGGAVACNCGDTLTSSWTMTLDLTSCTGDGIVINASNLILDCAGYDLRGDKGTYDFGIDNLGGYDNITIKNCNITNFDNGIYLFNSDNNTVFNNTLNSNSNGIYLYISSSNNLTNNTFKSNTNAGIYFYYYSHYSNITNSYIENNTYGVYISLSAGYNLYNNIYNNLFNNTMNIYSNSKSDLNYFNTTKTSGTNIIGGSWIGGNFLGDPYGTGHSEVCWDNTGDEICEKSVSFNLNTTDYLPLTSNSDSSAPDSIILGFAETYKPTYYEGEDVELIILSMKHNESIEDNTRFVGNNYNVSYRVYYPNGSIYIDWTNVTTEYSWGNTTFEMPSVTGTYIIQTYGNWVNISTNTTFEYSNSNIVPFYRQNIIDAANYIVSQQNVDGSFDDEYGSYYGPPVRILMWAYGITGNKTYYNASVNYLEDQIDTSDGYECFYGVFAYAEFQKSTNDTQFEENLTLCSQSAFEDETSGNYWFTKGELSEGLYEAWEVTGNETIKENAETLLSQIFDGNSWYADKNTWYFGTFHPHNYHMAQGTLTAFGVYWNNSQDYVNKAINASKYSVPNFLQYYSNTSSGKTMYSVKIIGITDNGRYSHFTAEPSIVMYGLYNATKDRTWLLKSSMIARHLASVQQSDGHYEDDAYPDDDIWATMWSIWGLQRFPWSVNVEVVDSDYNLTISDAQWYETDKILYANVSIPSGELGYIRFTIPENENVSSVKIDGVSTTNYTQGGSEILVWLSGSDHEINVSYDTTAPILSSISDTATASSATINWTTNELANSTVYYGSTTSTSLTTNSSNSTTSHSIELSGLSASTIYYYNVSSCDSEGNCKTSSQDSFTTSSSDSFSTSTTVSQPESDGPSSSFAILPSTKQLQKGYERTLKTNDKIEFKFKEDVHKLKLDKIIDDKTIQITISSEPITFNLSLNEIKKVNIDADSYYDLKVYLKKLTSSEADVVVKLISEEIPSDVSDEEKVVGSEVWEGAKSRKRENIIISIFISLIVAVIVFLFLKTHKGIKKRINGLKKK